MLEYVKPILKVLEKAAEGGSGLDETRLLVRNLTKEQRMTLQAWLYDLGEIVVEVRKEMDGLS